MTDLQTRAEGGLETRGGPAPLDRQEIWELPTEEQIGARQADVLIHSLRFRAGERIRLAREDVKARKRELKEVQEDLKRARKNLKRERESPSAFCSDDYDTATMAEVLREQFPERFNGA